MSGLVLGVVRLAALLGVCAGLTVESATAQQQSISSAFDRAGWERVLGYEDASDRPVWKRITLGRHLGVRAIREELEAAQVRVGDLADEVLGRPEFWFSGTPLTVDLVIVTPGDFGPQPYASLEDLEALARQVGLEVCPAEVGPVLRLAYLEQPIGEFLRIAMKPVRTYRGTPVSLTLANGGTGPLLIGGEVRPDLTFTPSTKFVFMRPQRLASPNRR